MEDVTHTEWEQVVPQPLDRVPGISNQVQAPIWNSLGGPIINWMWTTFNEGGTPLSALYLCEEKKKREKKSSFIWAVTIQGMQPQSSGDVSWLQDSRGGHRLSVASHTGLSTSALGCIFPSGQERCATFIPRKGQTHLVIPVFSARGEWTAWPSIPLSSEPIFPHAGCAVHSPLHELVNLPH